MTYLHKLPLNTLKKDQSFVRDMLSDLDDLSIVIKLALTFDHWVIAEAVETLKAMVNKQGQAVGTCPTQSGFANSH